MTWDLGEFRGWLDTVGRDAPTKEVLEVLRPFAGAPAAIRGYVATELLRCDVVGLCFGWSSGRNKRYTSLPGSEYSHVCARRRVFLHPKQIFFWNQYPSDVFDLFPEWPVCPAAVFYDRSRTDRHSVFVDDDVDRYFAHFANRIDRKSMLLR